MTFEQLGWWQQYDEKLKANVLKVAFSVYVASSVVFLATKKFQRNFSCSPNDIYRSKDVRKQRTMANIERDKHKIDKRKDIFLLIKAIFTGGFMSTKTDKEKYLLRHTYSDVRARLHCSTQNVFRTFYTSAFIRCMFSYSVALSEFPVRPFIRTKGHVPNTLTLFSFQPTQGDDATRTQEFTRSERKSEDFSAEKGQLCLRRRLQQNIGYSHLVDGCAWERADDYYI